MAEKVSFEAYVSSLQALSRHVDPTSPTAASAEIHAAAESLIHIHPLTRKSLSHWLEDHPNWLPVLGLVVGLSQERLKNALVYHFQSAGFLTLGRNRPTEVVAVLDEEYELLRHLDEQRFKSYTFGDVLVARAGTRVTASQGQQTGRRVEDEIERIAQSMRLSYALRTRFRGRNSAAPCDLAIPGGGDLARIVVAAKGFDSTGSKLTDAVREVQEMAEVRLPTQFVFAVIDGIGWHSRKSDLKSIYKLWSSGRIDGMYTLNTLDQFGADLANAARLCGLL